MRTVDIRGLYAVALITILSVTLFMTALFFVYLADDWASPAFDENSYPAPKF
jgi:hypothetical protein